MALNLTVLNHDSRCCFGTVCACLCAACYMCFSSNKFFKAHGATEYKAVTLPNVRPHTRSWLRGLPAVCEIHEGKFCSRRRAHVQFSLSSVHACFTDQPNPANPEYTRLRMGEGKPKLFTIYLRLLFLLSETAVARGA